MCMNLVGNPIYSEVLFNHYLNLITGQENVKKIVWFGGTIQLNTFPWDTGLSKSSFGATVKKYSLKMEATSGSH